ncbi:hypothetical protein A2U01_0054619, partial [Trifolium medium]|nr:hypothetical protein [Trifolium medium]
MDRSIWGFEDFCLAQMKEKVLLIE